MAVLASSGAAYAYWTAKGAGTGAATVAVIKPLEVIQDAVRGLVLDHAKSLTGTVSNPNSFEVSLKNTALTVTAAADRMHESYLPVNFKLVAPVVHADLVAANGSVTFNGGSITLVNEAKVDQAACQGATITLTYTLK